MVLELQELIKAPWASSTGEVQSPGKPELGKEKEALGQVSFSDLFLTRANLSFYLLPICFYSTLHMPFVNSKVSPQNPTGTLAGFGQWPILGMLARARLSALPRSDLPSSIPTCQDWEWATWSELEHSSWAQEWRKLVKAWEETGYTKNCSGNCLCPKIWLLTTSRTSTQWNTVMLC